MVSWNKLKLLKKEPSTQNSFRFSCMRVLKMLPLCLLFKKSRSGNYWFVRFKEEIFLKHSTTNSIGRTLDMQMNSLRNHPVYVDFFVVFLFSTPLRLKILFSRSSQSRAGIISSIRATNSLAQTRDVQHLAQPYLYIHH